MTAEELKKAYSNLTLNELLEIIDNKHQYTDMAVKTAIEEVAGRKVSEEDISQYKELQVEQAITFVRKNVLIGLTNFQKSLFYFFWLPILTFPFKQNYRDEGYELKLRQANYYSLCGFLVTLVNFYFSMEHDLSGPGSLSLAVLGIMAALYFDDHFNKFPHIRKLQEIVKEEREKEEEKLG